MFDISRITEEDGWFSTAGGNYVQRVSPTMVLFYSCMTNSVTKAPNQYTKHFVLVSKVGPLEVRVKLPGLFTVK